MKKSSYLHWFCVILSFLWSGGALSIFGIAAYAVSHYHGIGPIVVVISLVCIVVFTLLHLFLRHFWQRYYFEAKIAQAFNRKETLLISAQDPDIDLQLNSFGLALAAIAYALIIFDTGMSSAIGLWLASILLIAYLAALYWLAVSYMASRDFIADQPDSYIKVILVDEQSSTMDYHEVTITELRMAIAATLQDLHKRRS